MQGRRDPALLLRDAEVGGRPGTDVRVRGGLVDEVGPGLVAGSEQVLDCGGGALLPGLHDHHCHLLATAAAVDSVRCGADPSAALRSAPVRHGWVRAVDYHPDATGLLDRNALDAVRSDVPVRVQHRSGALWIVNSAGVHALALDGAAPDGVERDAEGRPTGRLWRLDGWLQQRWGRPGAPDLTALSDRLARYGITGVTDATPDLDADTVELLTAGMRQRLLLLGDPAGSGPYKLVVADHELPDPDELARRIAALRPRAVAVHCVSRIALALTVAALRAAGPVQGDRIEHAAVVPPEYVGELRSLGVTVVTQPSLLAERGDEYLRDVEPADADHLWPYASLLAGGVPVACSSDSPYGDLDPWATVRAAVGRAAPSGRRVAATEAVDAGTALAAFLSAPLEPGGPSRVVRVGAAADLVLLAAPLRDVLDAPSAERVRATLIAGELVGRGAG